MNFKRHDMVVVHRPNHPLNGAVVTVRYVSSNPGYSCYVEDDTIKSGRKDGTYHMPHKYLTEHMSRDDRRNILKRHFLVGHVVIRTNTGGFPDEPGDVVNMSVRGWPVVKWRAYPACSAVEMDPFNLAIIRNGLDRVLDEI